MSDRTTHLGRDGSGPDPVKCYWRVADRSDSRGALMVVTAVDSNPEVIGHFASAEVALAACGGHNRDLKLDRLVVLDDGRTEPPPMWVHVVTSVDDDEIHVFATSEDAEAYAGLFRSTTIEEHNVYDAAWVEQQREEIEDGTR